MNAKRWRHGIQPSAFVPRIGTTRRIQGLQALGWTARHIGAAAGLTVSAVYALANSANPTVLVESAEAIRQAAGSLGSARGPSLVARGQARGLGYVSLWAWDEDTIDNPDAEPATAAGPVDVDEVAVLRALHAAAADLPPAPLTRAERAVVVPRLAGPPYYLTDTQIERRLRMSARRVAALRSAAGVPRATVDQRKAAA